MRISGRIRVHWLDCFSFGSTHSVEFFYAGDMCEQTILACAIAEIADPEQDPESIVEDVDYALYRNPELILIEPLSNKRPLSVML